MAAQTKQGRNHKMKVTAAAHKLAERARTTEANYADGKLSAADVLRLAATHYNDDAVLTLLRNVAEHEAMLRDEPVEADTPPSSQSSASLQDGQEHSDEEQAAYSELEPMDSQEWSSTDWLQGNEQSELGVVSRSPTPPTLPANASDLVEPVCIICNDNPDVQEVISCGHFFCRPCLDRPEFEHCPICRTPKSDTFRIRIKTVMLAYKRDIDNSFGSVSGLQADHRMDGRRPGDTTIAQDLDRMSEELAATLQDGADGN